MTPTETDLHWAKKMAAQYDSEIEDTEEQLSKLRKNKAFFRKQKTHWDKEVVRLKEAERNRLLAALDNLITESSPVS